MRASPTYMADQELTNWCKLNGVVFNGIVAAFVSDGWRGIVATKDLKPGEVVLRVPERLLLTTRSAARDPHLAAALQGHTELSRGAAAGPPGCCGLSPLQVLACHLLLEVSRGPDSFWWPYLKQLPRSYTSLANFSPDDVAELQLRDVREVAEAAVERARTEWRQALPVLQDLGLPKRFTAFRAWLWATSTLHSRTMYLPWCPAGCLTPYGDLHNYQPPRAPYTLQLGGPAAACSSWSAVAAAAPVAGAVAVGPLGAPGQYSASGPMWREHATADAAAAAAASPLNLPLVLEPLTPLADVGGDEQSSPYSAPFGNGDANPAYAGCSVKGSSSRNRDGGGEDGEGDGQVSATRLSGSETANAGLEPLPPSSSSPSLGLAAADTAAVGNDGVKSGVGGSGGAGVLAEERGEEGFAIAGDGMWDEATQQYCVIVRRPYRQGEQVMLCYGRYTNLELLEHYGFVLQDNPHDRAQVDPALLPVPSAARTAAGAPHLAPPDCFLHANGQPSWQQLHLLRYCAATSAERRSAGHLMAAGERVSELGDRQALKWLHAACSSQLAALPTTLVQDLELWRQLNGTQELHVQQQQQQQQQQQEPVLQQQRSSHAPPNQGPWGKEDANSSSEPGAVGRAKAKAKAKAVPSQALRGEISSEKDVTQAEEEEQGAAEPRGAARIGATCDAADDAAVPECKSQHLAPSPQPSVPPAATAVAAALSDGLTCSGLALQWRIQQKQILLRALRYAEDVLGPEVHAASARGRPPVLAWDLSALIQRQRQVLAPKRPSNK